MVIARERENNMYSSNSELTEKVCGLIGWIYSMGVIKTFQRGNTVYVRATLLKPHEVADFQSLDGKNIGDAIIKTMNFSK